MEAQHFRTACEKLRRLSTQTPKSGDVWNLLGVCESELKNEQAARNAFQRALVLQPDGLGANQNAGYFFFSRNDFLNAKKYLQHAVALGSKEPEVIFNLAVAQRRSGETQAALQNLVSVATQFASRPAYWEERGWIEVAGNAAAAERSFEKALALAPESVRALNGAAAAAEAQGQLEKALALLIRARNAAPDDLQTLMHFGSMCLRQDLSVDALAALEHAHELAPDNQLALFLYGRAQIEMKQWQKAHDLFAEFDRRRPNYPPALFALGWLELKLARPDEGRAHLERSLQLDPEQPDVLYELGQLDLDDGRLEKAQTELQAALRFAPDHLKANLAMGDLAMNRGKASEAKGYYETAIARDPKDGPAHYKLATALNRLHDSAGAGREREMAATLNSEETKKSRTVLRLAEPDGTLLSAEGGGKPVQEH